jgi:hypothetical protein
MEDEPKGSEKVHKNNLGKAGEYLAAGKLLLNGFNVFIGAVDDGIDIVASKGGIFYKIQVKTCQDLDGYDSGKFMAAVNLTTLSRHPVETTYIIIVVHYLNGQISLDYAGNHSAYNQDYIVIPAEKIFEITGKTSGKAVFNIRSSLVTDDFGREFMYRLYYHGRSMDLDGYLFDSFLQINS